MIPFKGYHDIASVIFLTMPEELRFPCIEKISLHRLRDSMGAGLEPVLGLLRYFPSPDFPSSRHNLFVE